MNTWFKALALALFAIVSTGCVGANTMHTATPIAPGDVEVEVMPGAYGVSSSAGTVVVPNVELGLRTGISDNMDFGVKLNGLTVTSDLNIALINEKDFALSVDPTITFFYLSAGDASFLWTFLQVPVLFDVVKNDTITLVTGIKPGYIYTSVSAEDDNEELQASGDGFTIGATVGLKVRLAKSLAIMPSIDILAPVENFGDGFIFNGGIGLLF